MFKPNRFVGAERVNHTPGPFANASVQPKPKYRGVIKFGKHKNHYMDDVLETDLRYVKEFILDGPVASDLPADVKQYFELAVEMEADPLRVDPATAEKAVIAAMAGKKEHGEKKVEELKEELKRKIKGKQDKVEAAKAATALVKRKDEADW